MDESKLLFLKELDSKIDWNLETIKKGAAKAAGGGSSKGFNSPLRKLTKAQKRTAKRNLAFTLSQHGIQKKGVETVVFENPDATWRKLNAQAEGRRLRSAQGGNKGPEGIEIDMKKTRYEIMKFGMTGMSVAEKADAETQLAISLGAQPDKKPYVNYKELQETKKKEKEEKELKEASMIKPKLKLKSNRATKGSKSKKGSNSNKLSANNVIVKGVMGANNKGAKGGKVGGGAGKDTGTKKVFGGKRPDKRNREAARKNR